MTEVRVAHLHPDALRERAEACAVAWLPLGTIEWHGRHLPLGFDALKAEALCVAGARAIGGVVFPPQYYGDHRGHIIEASHGPESGRPMTFDHRLVCCETLGISVDGVAANAVRDDQRAAGEAHVELLERTYWMIRGYGFSRIVAVAGHYPNALRAQLAADRFHAKQSRCQVVCGHEGTFGDGGGDHAGAYETSTALALIPDDVRLDQVDDAADEPAGIRGEHPRHASAERGEATVAAFVAGCRERLGAVPARPLLAAPDEDGAQADWIRRRRTKSVLG